MYTRTSSHKFGSKGIALSIPTEKNRPFGSLKLPRLGLIKSRTGLTVQQLTTKQDGHKDNFLSLVTKIGQSIWDIS